MPSLLLILNEALPLAHNASLLVYYRYIHGPNAMIDYTGASSLIDGHDYAVPANFFCSGAGCDGTLTANPAVAGAYFDQAPSGVFFVKANQIQGNPPQQVGGGSSTLQDWIDYAEQLIPFAHSTLPGGVIAGKQTLGTRTNPEITVADAYTTFTGTVDGAGILIIREGVKFSGTLHYEGLVIVLNDADDPTSEINVEIEIGQGSAGILGCVVIAGDGESEADIQGAAEVKYSSEALANIANMGNLVHYDVKSWRRIT